MFFDLYRSSPAQNLIDELARQGRPVHPAMKKMATMLEEAESMAHLPKPGDASMAAAFTAKQSSVTPCIDLLKQGRSTLVSTVQMFKILGLMSLSSAFSLSVMAFEGVKIGDLQVFPQNLKVICFLLKWIDCLSQYHNWRRCLIFVSFSGDCVWVAYSSHVFLSIKLQASG